MNQQSTSNHNESNDPFLKVTVDAMRDAFGFTPHPFQRQVIPHIIKMKDDLSSPCLLVHGIGGDKSSIYQTVGIIKGGIILVIQNTLSLSSDQMSKISVLSSKYDGVHSLQLDSIKKEDEKLKICASLSSITTTTNKTIYIFASPEVLVKPPWPTLIESIILKRTLSFVCVDEVHLFVQFSISF